MQKIALNAATATAFLVSILSFLVAIHIPFFMGLLILPVIFWGVFFASLVTLGFCVPKIKEDISRKTAFFGSFAVIFLIGLVFLFASRKMSVGRCERVGALQVACKERITKLGWQLKRAGQTVLDENTAALVSGIMPVDVSYGRDDNVRLGFKRLSDTAFILYSVGPDGVDDGLAKKIDADRLVDFEKRFSLIGGPGGAMQNFVRTLCLWELTKARSVFTGDVVLVETTVEEIIQSLPVKPE